MQFAYQPRIDSAGPVCATGRAASGQKIGSERQEIGKMFPPQLSREHYQ